MREIKFRGKRPGIPAWAYGDLAHDKKVCADGSLADRAKVGGYEVDPATIGQFTGLRDAGGREIYEGDIIREDKDPTMMEIVFRDGIFFASIGNTHGENPYMNCALRVILDRRKTHIIGNVHDDPGLPGGGGK